jgi:hypothetical protein
MIRKPSVHFVFNSGTSSQGTKRRHSHVAVPSTRTQKNPCNKPART